MQRDETAVDDSTDAPSSPAAAAGRAVVPSEPRPEPAGRERADVAKVLAAEGRRGGRRRVTRLILIGVAVVAVAAGLGWGWVGWQSGSTPAYVTDPATIGDIAVVLTATGELQPTREVAVSSLVTGTIATVDVDYNQPVVKGQPLAHLDPSDLDARRQRAMATVDAQGAARDAAVANVTDAQSAFERASKLGADDTVSAREVELATTALTRAKANLAAAEAQL